MAELRRPGRITAPHHCPGPRAAGARLYLLKLSPLVGARAGCFFSRCGRPLVRADGRGQGSSRWVAAVEAASVGLKVSGGSLE